MPAMGVSVVEGTIVAWRVAVGDRIEAEQTICEISTDKIDTELPSPVSGVVAEILVQVDQTVDVGAVLARVAGGELDPLGRDVEPIRLVAKRRVGSEGERDCGARADRRIDAGQLAEITGEQVTEPAQIGVAAVHGDPRAGSERERAVTRLERSGPRDERITSGIGHLRPP